MTRFFAGNLNKKIEQFLKSSDYHFTVLCKLKTISRVKEKTGKVKAENFVIAGREVASNDVTLLAILISIPLPLSSTRI